MRKKIFTLCLILCLTILNNCVQSTVSLFGPTLTVAKTGSIYHGGLSYASNKYVKKKNVYYRPWGRYTNLFEGKEFLIKELFVKPKGILSLQKHHHRAEHWLVTQGNPKVTLNKENFIKRPNEHIFIPLEAIHRIQNPGKKPVRIMEAQVGSILKETDIVRYQDVYGRVK